MRENYLTSVLAFCRHSQITHMAHIGGGLVDQCLSHPLKLSRLS